MDKRQQITWESLLQKISLLSNEETLYFKRDCDLCGWGIKKTSVLGVDFLVLVDYSSNTGYSENIPCAGSSTDFVDDFIWKPLSYVNSRDMAFHIISHQEAECRKVNNEPAPNEYRLKNENGYGPWDKMPSSDDWEYVACFLPGYSNRDDVATSDDLSCVLDDNHEYKDLAWLYKTYPQWNGLSMEELKKIQVQWDYELFVEAEGDLTAKIQSGEIEVRYNK